MVFALQIAGGMPTAPLSAAPLEVLQLLELQWLQMVLLDYHNQCGQNLSCTY